jgi:hypothetical protein
MEGNSNGERQRVFYDTMASQKENEERKQMPSNGNQTNDSGRCPRE